MVIGLHYPLSDDIIVKGYLCCMYGILGIIEDQLESLTVSFVSIVVKPFCIFSLLFWGSRRSDYGETEYFWTIRDECECMRGEGHK